MHRTAAHRRARPRHGPPSPALPTVPRPRPRLGAALSSHDRGTGQRKTTQDAAGTGTEPPRRGTPVSGSTENQVTSPERSLAT